MFPTQEAGDFFNPNYVFVKYELDKADPEKIAETYGVRAYPTFIFLNGDGEEVIRMLGGGGDTKSFTDRITEVTKPENSFKARYEKFKNDPSYAMTYIQFLDEDCYMSEEADKLLNELFAKRSIAENFTDENLKLYNKKITSVEHPIFKTMIANEKEVKAVLGKEKYDNFMKDKSAQLLMGQFFARKLDVNNLNKVIADIESTKQLQSDYTKFVIKNKQAIMDKNVDVLAPLAMKAIAKTDTKSREQIINFVGMAMPRNNAELSKETMLSLYEAALKFEKNADAKKKYEDRIDGIKNPKKNSIPAMRMV